MNEDVLFEQAIREVQERRCVEALWARAIADGDGDKAKTISRYVRLRVEQLKHEARRPAHQAQPTSPPPNADQRHAPGKHRRTSASVWRRFFARAIDFLWEAPLVGLMVGYLGTINADLGEVLANNSAAVIGVLISPLVLLFDAAVVATFFNSPGKAILGLSVLNTEDKPLAAAEYLERNMRIWVSGLAFGLPLLNMLAAAYQGERAWRNGFTTYDQKNGTRVLATPLGIVQAVAAALLLVMLISFNTLIVAAFG